MSSSLNYPGGKGVAGVYQTIINQIPPHEVYVEPFAGGAAVFRHKRPAGLNLLYELNGLAFSNLLKLSNQTTFIQQKCGIELIELQNQSGRSVFYYCDPPYPLSTRTKRNCYGELEWSNETHVRFLEAVLDITEIDKWSPLFAISTYPNHMYEQRLKGWRRIEYESITRGGVMRSEWLLMNYAAPTELHDYRYYGRDKRHREKIRRAGRSMAGKLKARAARDPLAARAILSYVPEELR